MRHNPSPDQFRPTEELIASFGGASIMRTLDGEFHFRGGTQPERAKAQEWMDRFLTNTPSKVTKAP